MKITRNKTINNQTGITLIALVITIIVLLILAGIAISMLAGDNGILKQAADAKTKTNQASIEEQIKLAVMAAIDTDGNIDTGVLAKELNKIDKENRTEINLPYTVVINGVSQVITNTGIVRETTDIEKLIATEEPMTDNIILTDEKGDTITVPKNFNIAKSSPTLVTEGMIIEDSVDNQYIWIPVEADFTSVVTQEENTAEYYTAIKDALKTYTETYKDSRFFDVWYGSENYGQYGYYDGTKFVYYTNGNMTKTEYETLYRNMLKSIYKNKGFYIGRYEMGIGVVNSTAEAQTLTRTGLTEYTPSKETNTSTTVKTNAAPSIEGMNIPISKANAVPYNYITQSQAEMLAQKLGEEADYSNVNTSIMFGVQWDAVCVFIERYDKNNTATTKSQWLTENDYSKLWGNYDNATFNMKQGFYNVFQYNPPYILPANWKDKANKISVGNWLCTTGASEQNSSLNIYDFGGNLYEWTLEMYGGSGSYPVSARGAHFELSGSASYRSNDYTYSMGCNRSARTSLYIK